jgi:signal transduction histidine kinase
MASWALILPHAAAPAAWAVFGAGAVYTAATWLHVRRGRAVRAGAIATALCDALLVASICAATGGLASDLYPYFYLTQIAASIRFAAGAAFGMLAVNGLLSAALLLAAPAGAGQLALRIFYLLFATLMGSVLSRHARENLDVARAARDRAQNLLRRLIGAEEEERKRIAGELHDRMGARFFELYYGIDRCRGAIGDELPEARALLARLGADARACGDEIRELMNGLRPSVLDDFGVSEALREWGAALQEQGGVEVRLAIDAEAKAASPEANVALFRIAQEAVLNARKHARAQTLAIELAREDDGDELRLEIRDDGRGFDPRAPVRGRFGLFTMRERAEACGGRLEIDSAPGRGTRLRAVVPAGAAR